jgi:photosystem II stability/assembly factor-like uncharacterized protein
MFNKNNVFRNTTLFILLLISCLAMSCTTNSEGDNQLNLEGQWKLQALDNIEINNINATEEPLLISTNSGIYVNVKGDLIEFGLQGEPIVNVIQIAENEYIAAIKTLQLEGGDTTLYKTNNNGEQWAPHMGSFGGEENKYTRISDLQIKAPGSSTFYACGGGNIARTTDGGSLWNSVHLTWEHLGFALFVKPDPNDSDVIWAGGANAKFQPKLIRSSNRGDSWEYLSVLEGIDANVNDLFKDNSNSEKLIIGLSGNIPAANIIRRSEDNGETWETVFEGAGMYTFSQSPRNADLVYASGRNDTGTLFFLVSNNFGDTWQTIALEDSPGEIHVNDMVSVLEGGQEVIYLGTNKGLYSYTIEE